MIWSASRTAETRPRQVICSSNYRTAGCAGTTMQRARVYVVKHGTQTAVSGDTDLTVDVSAPPDKRLTRLELSCPLARDSQRHRQRTNAHLTTGTASIQVSIRNFNSQVDTSARTTRRRRKHERAIPTRRRQRALSSVTERHGHCDNGYWERHPHCLSVDTT